MKAFELDRVIAWWQLSILVQCVGFLLLLQATNDMEV